MLSRRHLRIKVMQALYGYSNASFDSIGAGEKEIMLSISRFYDLFLYQLLFISEIFETAGKQSEDAKHKHIPTREELNPNTRFLENPFLIALSKSATLQELYKKRNISWVGENEIARRAFTNFRNSSEYEKYLASDDNNFEKDKEIVATLVKKFIVDFPPLMQYYEERSIFWVDDIDIVNMILIKIIRSSKEENVDSTFTDLEWFVDDEDREFAIGLFRKTIMGSEKYEKIIADKTLNWELERIAMMDVLLMKMAVCEFTEFPSIPVKVTLNEYIDLAKMYSSPKSSFFINGILDKLIVDLKRDNLINKTGRGLM
jgi:N utilization substance protein B